MHNMNKKTKNLDDIVKYCVDEIRKLKIEEMNEMSADLIIKLSDKLKPLSNSYETPNVFDEIVKIIGEFTPNSFGISDKIFKQIY